MVTAKQEARTKLTVGLFVAGLALLGGVSLFVIGQKEGTWDRKTTIQTDFQTITGLRKGSAVWLAGVEIGTVNTLEFVNVSYQCDPATEDTGRHGLGRTDNCDTSLFCAPTGLCGELEPYATKQYHQPCIAQTDCNEDEICVTKEFRRRYRRTKWSGRDGVCARFLTDHNRVRVTMEIVEESLSLIRTDSRATVTQSGVLGDQLINVTPGQKSRDPVPPGGRIQSTPSLVEDLLAFRDRLEGLTDKVDSSLQGISNLFSELNDESTIANVKGTLRNVDEITRQIADGDGLVGRLINDEQYAADFGQTLRHVRGTAAGIDAFTSKANRSLGKIDANLQPAVDDARASLGSIKNLLEDLEDPKNKSVLAKLIRDDGGEWQQDVTELLDNLNSVSAKLDSGEGTLGKLVGDPKAHDDLLKILRNIERNNVWKTLVRWSIEADEANSNAAPRRGRPSAKTRKNPE